MRAILLIHRYLAVAVGLLMVLWCLSGFVMMYQSFPRLEPEQQLAGLAPLELENCCNLGEVELGQDGPLPAFRLEMLLGDPILRFNGFAVRGPNGTSSALNLRTGEPLAELSPEQVLSVAQQFGRGNAIPGEARSLGLVDIDQWTLQTARRNAPTWHFAFDDPAHTEIYVSARTGEVFQKTTRRERVLSWFGAIPHWLYPTVLRQNGALWTEIVVWTSVAGTFLAATGLYVGLSRLRRNRKGQLSSPFRGWWYWHHVSGLVFGILALTWVFSGLLTMNPWGTLSGGPTPHRSELVGESTWKDLRDFLQQVQDRADLQQFKRIEHSPFNHRFFVIAEKQGEPAVRLDIEGRAALMTAGEVDTALKNLSTPVREWELLQQEDAYYYGHKQDVSLPVYRVLLDDAEGTRLYINPVTGAVRALTAQGRLSRWIRTGLHDMDFAFLRARPVWDIVVMLLLAGVTSLCVIGTWLALKRVRMDWRIQRGRWRRRMEQRQSVHATRTEVSEP